MLHFSRAPQIPDQIFLEGERASGHYRVLNSQCRFERTQLVILTTKNAGGVKRRGETKWARIHLLHSITMRGHGREK